VLRLVGVEHLADAEAASLPVGTRRLLEVARALIPRPRVLLLDEVASGLDEDEIERLAALVRAIREAGPAVILVEHNFAHPWVIDPRFAKEFLFTGDRVGAERALALGMVNRVVPRAELHAETFALAEKIAAMPRLGLALTKKAVNQTDRACRPFGVRAAERAHRSPSHRPVPRVEAFKSLGHAGARCQRRRTSSGCCAGPHCG
jgi:ABC-type sugar transport system ATPase subunit